MTEKQRQFAKEHLYYRPYSGEFGYYAKGAWVVMGKGTVAEWCATTDEQLFSMYLKHRKSLRVAESRKVAESL